MHMLEHAMDKDKFNPVPHDANTEVEWLQDPEFKAAYNLLEGEYASLAANLTKNELHPLLPNPLPQGEKGATV